MLVAEKQKPKNSTVEQITENTVESHEVKPGSKDLVNRGKGQYMPFGKRLVGPENAEGNKCKSNLRK